MMIERLHVKGKFIFTGNEKFYVKGVTYGTFRPNAEGAEDFEPQKVEGDFRLMKANGINSVRTYTVPPVWFLDLAARFDLRVMIGLPWEQHIAFLDSAERVASIEQRVRDAVRQCAGHPAVLCYTIGNEIPSQIVRWYGRRKIERFLKHLYDAAKREDPEGLVTYVNYPSTEYLNLPFVDFYCFNVYLETEEKLTAYLARLQTLAGDRPLVMAEIGLDSRRNGAQLQAETLAWQVRTVFANGCAGAFLFAWTDEWWRGGFDIEDWDFGLTTRAREPKPALGAVRQAFAETPFPRDKNLPRISVVVCSYNGARYIRDCLEGLSRLDYTNYEMIVVDDGSTDQTAAIAAEYLVRIISTENRGLSSARNTGWQAATGEIVAYTDDDARPDPHWLRYLAESFTTMTHAGIGGPNIAPAGDGVIADCVANSPGGPMHVLLTDTEAEHIPGCNMAFRREWLERVGGFDPRYRAAGDDVDICWRVQAEGGTLGFSPAAMVWHHRRNSVRAYWKQQQGYGRAEALLEEKHPEKYNGVGHLTWSGRIYGKGLTQQLRLGRGRIYQGMWGSAPFQSIYEPAQSFLFSLPLMPEWYLVIALLIALSLLGIWWAPLLFGALPPLAIATGALLGQAAISASRATFTSRPQTLLARVRLWTLTALLHLIQPLARLRGRLRWGLTPWRMRGASDISTKHLSRRITIWSEEWESIEEKLGAIEERLRASGVCALRGNDYDDWDLELCSGIFARSRLYMTVEEHGGGKQHTRFRLQIKSSMVSQALIFIFGVLALCAALDGARAVAAILAALCLAVMLRLAYECTSAMAGFGWAITEAQAMKASREGAQAIEVSESVEISEPAVIPQPVEFPQPDSMRLHITIQPDFTAHADLLRASQLRATRVRTEFPAYGSGRAVVPTPAVSSVASSLFQDSISNEALSSMERCQSVQPIQSD